MCAGLQGDPDESVFGIRAIWGNAEDRRKDKQGGGFISFRWPKNGLDIFCLIFGPDSI